MWTSLASSLSVELTRDLVLVGLNKLCDHSPNHMELLSLGGWHWLTQIFKLKLGLLEFALDLVHNLRQVVSNMSEQYPCHLRGENLTTKIPGWHSGVNRVSIEETLLLGLSFFD